MSFLKSWLESMVVHYNGKVYSAEKEHMTLSILKFNSNNRSQYSLKKYSNGNQQQFLYLKILSALIWD